MIGMAKLASALIGTNTYVSGFAVTPTGPASMQVVYAPGEIYSLSTIDALAFSTLPADTTHSILKQGILLDGGTLSCPAPGTTGQSINYLVQATYQDVDSSPVLLPYYNSAKPAMPFSGIGNNGLTQNTVRKGTVVVSVKAGASAVTGSQTTPSPDAGYVGLYVVTVAFGQTTITAGNITTAPSAPIINSTLHGLSPVFTVSPTLPNATQSQQALTLGRSLGRLMGSPQTFFSAGSATYTPSPGTIFAIVHACSGAGAGGGTVATAASQVAVGSGGASGSYWSGVLTAAQIGSSLAITVGSAGTAVSGASGNNGSATSIGALVSIPGGQGGLAGGAVSNTATAVNGGGQPGAAPTSTAQTLTQSGGASGGYGIATPSGVLSGYGGGSPTTGGAGGGRAVGTGNAGAPSTSPGSGGSGACAGASSAALAGGAGGAGFVIIYEYGNPQ
ncbi:hypothetical protein A9HBioS_3015 [Pseudomonas koreensis]|uniref:Glycine-rich domain-containing protein n=2 Tax=Pseudomonas koreensis TaxID=198620 RepID=A0AA94ENW3_9PSED|nr:hypothetical protein A9HBioS_3015 [Pseudomonas koreensis]